MSKRTRNRRVMVADSQVLQVLAERAPKKDAAKLRGLSGNRAERHDFWLLIILGLIFVPPIS